MIKNDFYSSTFRNCWKIPNPPIKWRVYFRFSIYINKVEWNFRSVYTYWNAGKKIKGFLEIKLCSRKTICNLTLLYSETKRNEKMTLTGERARYSENKKKYVFRNETRIWFSPEKSRNNIIMFRPAWTCSEPVIPFFYFHLKLFWIMEKD